MNKNLIILIIAVVIALTVVWSIYHSRTSQLKPKATQTTQHQQPTTDQIMEIAGMIECPDSSFQGMSVAETDCDTSRYIMLQIGSLLAAGLTPDRTMSHLLMFGYRPLESELPPGHPPIGRDSIIVGGD